MVKLGIIKPSKSNYLNSMLIVKKTKKPFMSSLDSKSNYWQIGLAEKSKQYNAFIIVNRVMESNMTNLKGIKSLLDFVRFYTRLVNNYAILTITWLKLIRKHVRFKCKNKIHQFFIHYEKRLFLTRKNIAKDMYIIISDEEKG